MLFVLTLRVSEYVVHPPDIQTLALIYKAANFWRMDRYETFCASILSRRYVDDYTQITERPLEHARIAVELGMLPKSTSILRRAFYDLARGVGDPDQSLETMASRDLATLLKVQKNLIYAWDNLFTSLYPLSPSGPQCNGCRKKNRHPGRLNIANTRKEYPFDPLFAIQAILSDLPDFGFLETKEVEEKLTSQRSKIWNSINVWIGLGTTNSNIRETQSLTNHTN